MGKALAIIIRDHYFSQFGLPKKMLRDFNGEINNETYEEICKELNYPPSNDNDTNLVESSHVEMEILLKDLNNRLDGSWEDVLSPLLMALHSTKHPQTGVTPFWATYGREANLPFDLLHPNTKEEKELSTEYGKQLHLQMSTILSYLNHYPRIEVQRSRYNNNGKLGGYLVLPGELVWIYTPSSSPWSGPWEITERITPLLFNVKPYGDWNPVSTNFTITIDRMKRYSVSTDRVLRSHSDDKTHPLNLLVSDEFLEESYPRNKNTIPEDQESAKTSESSHPVTPMLSELPKTTNSRSRTRFLLLPDIPEVIEEPLKEVSDSQRKKPEEEERSTRFTPSMTAHLIKDIKKRTSYVQLRRMSPEVEELARTYNKPSSAQLIQDIKNRTAYVRMKRMSPELEELARTRTKSPCSMFVEVGSKAGESYQHPKVRRNTWTSVSVKNNAVRIIRPRLTAQSLSTSLNKGISSTIKKKLNIIPLTTRLMTLQTGCQALTTDCLKQL